MDLSNLLNGAMGETLVSSIASQLGVDQKQAKNAVEVALPAILGGLNKNAQSKEGATGLNKALDKHDGSLLDNLAGMLSDNSQEIEKDGGGILGHVFGSKQGQVENVVSQKSGIDASQAGKLMSMLAPVAMSYLGKQKRENNANENNIGDLIGGLLGGGGAKSSQGGIMDVVTNLLDKDKDGSIVDDIFDMFKKK